MTSQSVEIGTLISQFLVNTNVNDVKADEVSSKISKLIESKELKLLDFVKALGDYLTADDDLLRPKATLCLSSTLKELNALTPSDISVLNGFFISKVEDVKSTKEALIGLSYLIDKENFSTSNIKQVLEALEKFDPKAHLASTRYYTFEILDKLFEKFEKFIKRFSQDFYIKVFIEIASGEKDPKNLLKSFSLNHKISSSFDITNFQDDLFDILFCYFPISFKPPKDDPYKISSEELKESLRTAIASSSLFSKDSYPNLLEKLTSTSPAVKRDTIQTINACIENYGPESISNSWVELWNGLKFEILHGDQDDDEDGIFPLVLQSFKTIAKNLTVEAFEIFIEAVNKELKPNIKISKTIKQTCAIYGSIASANVSTFNNVTHSTLLLLLNDSNQLNVPKQRTLIANLGFFTNSYIELFGTNDDNKANPEGNSLLDFKDEILILLGKALMGSSKVEVSLRTLAIAEITKLTTLKDFLNESELSLIVQYFTETVLSDDNEYIFNSSIGGLIQISKINTSLILEVTLPTLLSLLPDSEFEAISVNDEIKPKEKIFEILSSIAINKEISDYLVIRLINKLSDGVLEYNEFNLRYFYLIVSTIKEIILSSQRNSTFATDSYLKRSFSQLVNLSLQSIIDNDVLEAASDVIKLIVLYSNKSHHQKLIDETLDLFFGQTVENSVYYVDTFNTVNVLETPIKQINVLVKILSAVDKSVKASDDLLNRFIDFVAKHEFLDGYTKIGYLQTISLLVNKWGPLPKVDITDAKHLEIFTWITKGAVLQSSPESAEYVQKLVKLLVDSEYGTLATKSFEILIVDLSVFDKFKKINNNNVRILYKQKFFVSVLPKLVEGFTSSQDLGEKSNYLTALSYILKHTKRDIIAPHISSFFPLLLQSLLLPNSDVRYASVQTILSSVDDIRELIIKHLQSLIPSLLKLIKADHLNNAEVRLVSLNCLQGLTYAVPLQNLIPYQNEIIRKVGEVLGDKKRSVRKGAVDARQAYFELGRSTEI